MVLRGLFLLRILSRARALLFVLATVSLVYAASYERDASAQDIRDLPSPSNPPLPPLHIGSNQELPYWAQGRIRPFVAAVFDVGGIFTRAELNLGYGRPHYLWGGIDVWSKLSLDGVTLYTGPRFTLGSLDVRGGIREVQSLSQHFVARQDVYYRPDLNHQTPPRGHYQSFDGEMSIDVPALGGSIGMLAGIYGIIGVPKAYNVFEDYLRVVVQPPIAWQTRFSYVAFVNRDSSMAVGGQFQLIGNPNRDLLVFRTGPVVSVALTDHLHAIAAASIVAASKDHLGIAGDEIGEVALRYRWASGEAWPQFP